MTSITQPGFRLGSGRKSAQNGKLAAYQGSAGERVDKPVRFGLLEAYRAKAALLKGDILQFNTLKATLDREGKTLDLRHIDLKGASLQGANLQATDLEWAKLSEADLWRADLRQANLQWADLRGARLEEADLREAVLQGANLQGANLQAADLEEANLHNSSLQRVNFRWASLQRADLRRALLEDADFVRADLRGANLQGAWLRHAKFRHSKLEGAILTKTALDPNLSFVGLSRSQLQQAGFELEDGFVLGYLPRKAPEGDMLFKSGKTYRVPFISSDSDSGFILFPTAAAARMDYPDDELIKVRVSPGKDPRGSKVLKAGERFRVPEFTVIGDVSD